MMTSTIISSQPTRQTNIEKGGKLMISDFIGGFLGMLRPSARFLGGFAAVVFVLLCAFLTVIGILCWLIRV